MYNWEIRRIYEDMIDMYEKNIGKQTKFGVEITYEFILSFKTRLAQLSTKYKKDWNIDGQAES